MPAPMIAIEGVRCMDRRLPRPEPFVNDRTGRPPGRFGHHGRMPSWDFVRGTAGVAMLVDAGAAHGLTAEACLRGSGLRPAHLADPATRVEAGQELAVARSLIAQVGDVPGLGVAAGRTMTLGTFGVWIFAFITSRTLGDAVDLA